MQKRRNDECPDTKEAGKAWYYRELIHGATISQGTRLDVTTTAYCQLIRDANKVKRLEFARHVLESGDTFQNVIFSDECSVSLEQYRQTCYRRIDEPTKQKPKPKHPLKVHVWAGLVDMVPQRFASLMASWMPISIVTSWRLCSKASKYTSGLPK